MKLLGVVVFTIGLVLAVLAGRELWLDLRDDAAAQSEYTHLRELSGAMFTAISSAEKASEAMQKKADGNPPHDPEKLAYILGSFSEINSNFVGWIVIPGTTVDYPIVRGYDNSRYLYTTFSGERNPAGAIFMDYRCTGGFGAPVSLIHGHNMRGGSMFSPLTNYLQQEFMENHPEILIMTADGDKLVYRIFEARRTNARDSVYMVDYSDAQAAAEFFDIGADERLLILSTCIGGANTNARLLVYAALEQ